ncbi:hypothetical protein NITHO_1400002 [Nitrolancea hollandica Lb]|uniref:Uncharacterized protein n=1 Tax=Nitrolancea hollandica Lb TaxID=1129897 RepID=I4ED89_9BACT|nr:hypothetical protein NITHO_1400002 [Nitrolancea hollandica Lb]
MAATSMFSSSRCSTKSVIMPMSSSSRLLRSTRIRASCSARLSRRSGGFFAKGANFATNWLVSILVRLRYVYCRSRGPLIRMTRTGAIPVWHTTLECGVIQASRRASKTIHAGRSGSTSMMFPHRSITYTPPSRIPSKRPFSRRPIP